MSARVAHKTEPLALPFLITLELGLAAFFGLVLFFPTVISGPDFMERLPVSAWVWHGPGRPVMVFIWLMALVLAVVHSTGMVLGFDDVYEWEASLTRPLLRMFGQSQWRVSLIDILMLLSGAISMATFIFNVSRDNLQWQGYVGFLIIIYLHLAVVARWFGALLCK
jgi:hypothetical protein